MSYSLPKTAPSMGSLSDVRSPEFLPLALYTLVDLPHSTVAKLATKLEDDAVIMPGKDGKIHLIAAAPEQHVRQPSLGLVLNHHIQYSTEHRNNLQYFPYGLLVIHDKAWEANGSFLVHADFEEPFPVTSFRLKTGDVKECCASLQNDDADAEELREEYETKS